MNGIGLLFPGQGAQTVGMGQDLAEHYASARAVFDQANEALDLELDRLCFEGPLEELSRSDVAQPAILTVSIAALRAMQEEAGASLDPVATAGLSLGEYSALVAAGAVDFRTAVRLVRTRGLAMQKACEANPGTMYSIIGLEDNPVEQACESAREQTGGGVWPANYNCPGQLVISGEDEPARVAADLCTAMGARRAIRLNVAGAFHTELMQPAAERMAAELRAASINAPSCPVVANVTGSPVADADEIRRLLVAQIVSPVRWVDCMNWFIAQGAERYYEVGPGRVLQGLLRRIDPSRTCSPINAAQDVRTYAERKDT